MTQAPKQLLGGCLCGRVRYRICAPFRPIIVCHCRQCARWSGHNVAATAVSLDRFCLESGEELVRWYEATDLARRGFCSNCGSLLFWHSADGDRISIMAGSLDQPSGLEISAHIYVGDKSDYELIDDGLPQYEAGRIGLQAAPKLEDRD